MSGLLIGKAALVTGVTNDRSIAWAIAQEFHRQGAKVIITCQSEAHFKRANRLAQTLDSELLICDFSMQKQVEQLFSQLADRWQNLDILSHCIAYARSECLEQEFINCSKEDFLQSMDISVYSLISAVQHALPLMHLGGSISTLSYHGAHKVIPYYHLMGVAKAALESSVRYLAADIGHKKIRINTISAGPVKTLASSVMPRFQDTLDLIEQKVPLRENIQQTDVAQLASFLASDASQHITGTTLYVDSGLHILGA